jgi:uncharacterized caspase-like protein
MRMQGFTKLARSCAVTAAGLAAATLMVLDDAVGESSTKDKRGAPTPRGMAVSSGSAIRPLPLVTPAVKRAKERYRRRIALVIGIDRYATAWAPLRAAVADAGHMAKLLLAMGFEVRTIPQEAATREGILKELEEVLPSLLGERDLLMVFFAGHGATLEGEGYLVARDSDADLARTAISFTRLRDAALALRNKHTIYLIDACFSGLMVQQRTFAQADDSTFWEANARDRIVQLLTAGQHEELAIERDGWGLFTRALHDGLAGAADRDGDAVIAFDELAGYVRERVLERSEGRQHPQAKTLEGSGNALLLDERLLPEASPSSGPRARPTPPEEKAELTRARAAIQQRQWDEAESLLRELLLAGDSNELRLLLAQVFLEKDARALAKVIDEELRHVLDAAPTQEDQVRAAAIRRRLAKALGER